jgi:hypothetical protein
MKKLNINKKIKILDKEYSKDLWSNETYLTERRRLSKLKLNKLRRTLLK